jgi:pimeloyl-ACP methyl ester carboxylesterase
LVIDTTMTLPDGRSLAYTDGGAPDGPLVVYFHGAPTSRLDLIGLEESFSALGVRVVSPDRPGYGRSSPRPGRGFTDWPGDVAALADHLGVERFAVVGASSGGPYVVACAALLPDRIAGAGVVAGVTDMGWSGAWEGYEVREATLMRLGDEAAAVRWCEEHFGPDGSKFLETTGELAPADMALLEDEAMATGFIATIGEAFRQGVGGMAQDVTVQGRPWPFDPSVITAPTRVLHGEADTLVPIAHGRHTAEVIPGASLVIFPDHGHLSIFTEIPQLSADLTRSLR